MTALITFPVADGEFLHATGEGGLFVIAAWPMPEDDGGRGRSDHFVKCHVDVWPELTLGDVLVTSGKDREAVFGDAEWSREPYPTSRDRDAEDAWSYRNLAQASSLALYAAVHLGSTSQALSYVDRGEYWQAYTADLTDAGRALCDTLDAAYGVPRVLLTYLDT